MGWKHNAKQSRAKNAERKLGISSFCLTTGGHTATYCMGGATVASAQSTQSRLL